GVETARDIVMECRKIGIKYLTLYTFSKENWKRPAEEVSYLFKLLSQFLGREISKFDEQDIRLNVLGDVDGLPAQTRAILDKVCSRTAANSSLQVNLALNYSSRDELAMACRRMLEDGLLPEQCTPDAIAARLYTGKMPDPDLVIRTSGEQRISNFLLFQCAYSEFYFTPTLWPDFNVEELRRALADFAGRQRRFGTTGEQIENTSRS
ncbi:MAG: di-trans,poly-cis-decaprenylcistransferase, partial [Desulfovibrionaceae bacterium]|nr:di-trans,poly-cis-decaprenylcistransferase [Desulfovibrionaceae bacterium]